MTLGPGFSIEVRITADGNDTPRQSSGAGKSLSRRLSSVTRTSASLQTSSRGLVDQDRDERNNEGDP